VVLLGSLRLLLQHAVLTPACERLALIVLLQLIAVVATSALVRLGSPGLLDQPALCACAFEALALIAIEVAAGVTASAMVLLGPLGLLDQLPVCARACEGLAHIVVQVVAVVTTCAVVFLGSLGLLDQLAMSTKAIEGLALAVVQEVANVASPALVLRGPSVEIHQRTTFTRTSKWRAAGVPRIEETARLATATWWSLIGLIGVAISTFTSFTTSFFSFNESGTFVFFNDAATFNLAETDRDGCHEEGNDTSKTKHGL